MNCKQRDNINLFIRKKFSDGFLPLLASEKYRYLNYRLKNSVKEHSSYSKYLNFISYLNSHLSEITKVENIPRAAKVSWNAMHSGPSFCPEPIFLKIFNMDIPNSISPSVELDERDNAFKLLSAPNSGTHKLLRKHKKQIIDALDLCLDLKGKRFPVARVDIALQALPQSTSSAWPKYIKKSLDSDSIRVKMNRILYDQDLSWLYYPITIRWRTQQRLLSLKFRQFYMLAFLILAFEMMYLYHILIHFRDNKFTSYSFANTFDHTSSKIKKIRKRNKNNSVIGFDFKSFDLSLSIELIHFCFNYLKSKIVFKTSSHSKIFNALMFYHCFCMIMTRLNGKPISFIKQRGLMSGSCFTNLIGSIANLVMIICLKIKLGHDIKREDLMVMGDDSLCSFTGTPSMQYCSAFMLEEFGTTVSIEKSFYYPPGWSGTYFYLGYEVDERGRYADFELFKKQLTVSEYFIPEDILPTKTRLFSKLASICFKCCDGYKFWDEVSPLLARELGCSIPSAFIEIYSVDGAAPDYSKYKSISDYKFNGWRAQ